MNTTNACTLTMAQSVGERILDTGRSGDVTIAEMDNAVMAVGLALGDGEIDNATAQAFLKLIEIGVRRLIQSSRKGDKT